MARLPPTDPSAPGASVGVIAGDTEPPPMLSGCGEVAANALDVSIGCDGGDSNVAPAVGGDVTESKSPKRPSSSRSSNASPSSIAAMISSAVGLVRAAVAAAAAASSLPNV